jgi:hypothetical protein
MTINKAKLIDRPMSERYTMRSGRPTVALPKPAGRLFVEVPSWAMAMSRCPWAVGLRWCGKGYIAFTSNQDLREYDLANNIRGKS